MGCHNYTNDTNSKMDQASFYMMQRDLAKKPEMRLRQVQVREEVVEVHNKAMMKPAMGLFN